MVEYQFANMAMHDPKGPVDPKTRRVIRAQAMRHFRTQQKGRAKQQQQPSRELQKPPDLNDADEKSAQTATKTPPVLPPDFGVIYAAEGVKLRDVKYWYFATAGSNSHMSFLPRLWDLSMSDPLLFECAISRGLDRKMELLGAEIDYHYLSSRQRIIEKVQIILIERGRNVTTSVIIAVALLAWLDILIGDLANSLMHFRGLQQLEMTEQIDQTTWFYITWPVLRLALLHGEEPTLVTKSFPLPLAWTPPIDASLTTEEEKAVDNSQNSPSCLGISRAELAQLYRVLHIHASNPTDLKVYNKNLHALEYQLAVLMARFRQISRPTSDGKLVGLILLTAQLRAWSVLHMRVSAREASFRSILHRSGQLLKDLDILQSGHLSCVIWILTSLLSYRPDARIYQMKLLQCVRVLGLTESQGLTLIVEDWPWPKDDDLEKSIYQTWTKLGFFG